MATTPEQRNRHAMCGAKKKNGDTCRAYAGQGTSHPGTGACRHHFGNAPNHDKRAAKMEVTRRMAAHGEPVADVTAVGALLNELQHAAGHVFWLRQELSEMSEDDIGTLKYQALVSRFDTERDRLTRTAKLCTEANVDEASIRVAETQVTIMGNALVRACDATGLSPEVKRRLGSALRAELAAAEAKPQAALTA